MYNEELLTDEQYRQLSRKQQSEIIVNYCTDIEESIRSAQSREEALRLKELGCTGFEQACLSRLISTALTKHADELVSRYWNKEQI
jgi:hypothetical protein